jgi:hypothetical protein
MTDNFADIIESLFLPCSVDKLGPVHDIKSYLEERAIGQLILNLGTSWR